MTAYKFVTLTCDCCGEVFDDGRSTIISVCRADASKWYGWTSGNGNPRMDWCGFCSGKAVCDHSERKRSFA